MYTYIYILHQQYIGIDKYVWDYKATMFLSKETANAQFSMLWLLFYAR